jgi:moderate conductance mechanosensitive channel
MLGDIFRAPSMGEILIALLILIGFCGLAWILRIFLVRIVKKFAQKTQTNLDDAILASLQKPLIAIVILAGFFMAVVSFNGTTVGWLYLTRGLAIALSLMGIIFILILLNTLVKWYRWEVAAKKKDVGFSLRLVSLCWVAIIVAAAWMAVIISLSIWGLSVTPVTGWLGAHGWRIGLITALAVAVVISMGEIIPRIIVRTLTRRPDDPEDEVAKRSDTLSKVLVSTIQVFVIFIALFMILAELQIDIAPILAGAGVVGIAVGFGAQSLVKDLVAGLFIIIENQYRVGDVIKIADVSGIVEGINLRRTVLRDLDGIVHVVPNGEIRVASNFTKEWSRVNLNISVAYGEDLDHVTSVINRVGKDLSEDPQWSPLILKAPQVLRVDNLGDSGVEIKILGDTKPIRQWDVMGELRRRLKKAFDEEDIEIPWPHTKVYLGNTKPKSVLSPDPAHQQ